MAKININLPDMPYAVEEALNRLRINIKFCGKNTKKILIISSIPNEGKSFVSIHLWRMLSEAGFKTVLMDTDLRKSVLQERYDFKTEGEVQGLDYYLSGLAEYSDVLCDTNIENGYIVPCTNLLENPSTLLEDPRLNELFNQLSEDFRYIIVDAPPLINVADGALIATMCDGAILVVNSGETAKSLVRQSLSQLERANCKLLGMVLNKAEVANRAYYKYYGKYGKYYYGGNSQKND